MEETSSGIYHRPQGCNEPTNDFHHHGPTKLQEISGVGGRIHPNNGSKCFFHKIKWFIIQNDQICPFSAHTVVGYMVQFILNSAVYIYIYFPMYGTTSPKQEKRQSKGNFINIINLPNQHQSTQSTSYARHQSTSRIARSQSYIAPSISSSAQLNLQRSLQDLMAIFQSTTSLLRGLEYGLYWFVNQFLFLRDI